MNNEKGIITLTFYFNQCRTTIQTTNVNINIQKDIKDRVHIFVQLAFTFFTIKYKYKRLGDKNWEFEISETPQFLYSNKLHIYKD